MHWSSKVRKFLELEKGNILHWENKRREARELRYQRTSGAGFRPRTAGKEEPEEQILWKDPNYSRDC